MAKNFFLIWLAGIPGILTISWLVLPSMLEGRALAASPAIVSIASAAQSALLLALASWAGVKLAPQVGLHAPVFEAASLGQFDAAILRAQLLPGMAGGILGAVVLVAFTRFAPEQLAQLQERFVLPIAARVLYGGITEEILVRWGLMTVLVWIFWRLFDGGTGLPSATSVWVPVVLSALAFGALHLPVVVAMLGSPTVGLASYIVLANAAFGVVAGYLYWRHGLEAAILAHIVAHLGAAPFTR